MAGSLKTTNYQLAKYAPDDITSWLTDFNGNMDLIDKGMQENKHAAAAADDKATNAAASVSALTETVQGNTDSIEANEKAIAANNAEIENLKTEIGEIVITEQIYFDDTKESVTAVQTLVPSMQMVGRSIGGVFAGSITVNLTPGELELYNRQATISGNNQYITDLFRITGNPFNLTDNKWTRLVGIGGGWFSNMANFLTKSDMVIGYVADSGYTVIGFISNTSSKINLVGNVTCQTMNA